MAAIEYLVAWDRKATDDVRRLADRDRRLVIQKVDVLEHDPRPRGCVKLTDDPHGRYRVRAGRYRILYHVDDRDKVVVIARVARRDESTYRG